MTNRAEAGTGRRSRLTLLAAVVAAGVVAAVGVTVVPSALADEGPYPGFLSASDLGAEWRFESGHPLVNTYVYMPPCGDSGSAPFWEYKQGQVGTVSTHSSARATFSSAPYANAEHIRWDVTEKQTTLWDKQIADVADAFDRYRECTRSGGGASGDRYMYGNNWIMRFGQRILSDGRQLDSYEVRSWILTGNQLVTLESYAWTWEPDQPQPFPGGPDGLDFMQVTTQAAADRCAAGCVDRPL